jgi:proteasome lid subunit RPN8/RPN11
MSGVFDRLIGGKRSPIRRVVFDGNLLDELLKAAKNLYPREFGALLEGSLEAEVLKINGYILPQSLVGKDNILMNIGMLPSTTDTIGSIHSHPSKSALASTSDIHFFKKRGLVHFIVANPYVRSKVKGYDRLGRSIRFSVEYKSQGSLAAKEYENVLFCL